MSAGLISYHTVHGELRTRPMTRHEYRALRSAIRAHRTSAAISIKACEYADSPMWAAREESQRQASRLVWLQAALPQPKKTEIAALLHFQCVRRAVVNKRIRERKAAALQAERAQMTRMPTESLLDFVDRKCGFAPTVTYLIGEAA